MKCVRERCQAAPGGATRAADERQPGGAVLGGDDVEAERLAEAVPVDADGRVRKSSTIPSRLFASRET
jgi:hypothetical protein